MNDIEILNLTNNLLQALGQNYTVVNMDVVISVISFLEVTTVTKEQLKATRIANYINNLRRRTKNGKLKSRARKLLKKWRVMFGMDQVSVGSQQQMQLTSQGMNSAIEPSKPLISSNLQYSQSISPGIRNNSKNVGLRADCARGVALNVASSVCRVTKGAIHSVSGESDTNLMSQNLKASLTKFTEPKCSDINVKEKKSKMEKKRCDRDNKIDVKRKNSVIILDDLSTAKISQKFKKIKLDTTIKNNISLSANNRNTTVDLSIANNLTNATVSTGATRSPPDTNSNPAKKGPDSMTSEQATSTHSNCTSEFASTSGMLNLSNNLLAPKASDVDSQLKELLKHLPVPEAKNIIEEKYLAQQLCTCILYEEVPENENAIINQSSDIVISKPKKSIFDIDECTDNIAPIRKYQFLEDNNCKAKQCYDNQKNEITEAHILALHNCSVQNVNGDWDDVIHERSNKKSLNYEVTDGSDVVPQYGSLINESISKDLSKVSFKRDLSVSKLQFQNVPFLGVAKLLPSCIEQKQKLNDNHTTVKVKAEPKDSSCSSNDSTASSSTDESENKDSSSKDSSSSTSTTEHKEFRTGFRNVDINGTKVGMPTHVQKFKEWHQVHQKRSYNNEPLTILPYVVLE